jgi:hypothetical protein
MQLRQFRPPAVAWITVVAAVLLGIIGYVQSPAGVYLYTPRDWCTGRANTFGLGYILVLFLGSAIAVLFLFWDGFQWIAREPFSESEKRRIRKSSSSLALFVLALTLSPLADIVFPLQQDPKCIKSSPGVEAPKHVP